MRRSTGCGTIQAERLFVSRLAALEIVSAFAGKVRAGHILDRLGHAPPSVRRRPEQEKTSPGDPHACSPFPRSGTIAASARAVRGFAQFTPCNWPSCSTCNGRKLLSGSFPPTRICLAWRSSKVWLSSTRKTLDRKPVPCEILTSRSPGVPCFRPTGTGLGVLGLAGLLQEEGLLGQASAASPLTPKPPHFQPRAKRVIFLFMNGGPSQVDTFDPKPGPRRNTGPAAERPRR